MAEYTRRETLSLTCLTKDGSHGRQHAAARNEKAVLPLSDTQNKYKKLKTFFFFFKVHHNLLKLPLPSAYYTVTNVQP